MQCSVYTLGMLGADVQDALRRAHIPLVTDPSGTLGYLRTGSHLNGHPGLTVDLSVRVVVQWLQRREAQRLAYNARKRDQHRRARLNRPDTRRAEYRRRHNMQPPVTVPR